MWDCLCRLGVEDRHGPGRLFERAAEPVDRR
jgi:hypothetical protein